ncbi:MAG TPA: hypothetical protein VK870_13090, partial [Ignavibacteriaceae bacterium]|nr:hypothetical protein [Ignavibacteriaceae bacterium]
MRKILMLLVVLTLICLIMTFSCSRKEEKSLSYYRNPNNKVVKNNIAFLDPVDTIIIQVPPGKGTYFLQKYLYNDSVLYGVSLYEKSTIDVYNIESKQFVNEIKIDPGPTRTLSISNFTVASPDSIYIIPSPLLGVHLYNSKGELVKIWNKDALQINES